MPVNAILNLTNRCNQNCIFCCDGDIKGEAYALPLPDIEQKLAEFKAIGVKQVTLIGGEPTVRKDLLTICRKAKVLGLKVTLTTNGLKLSDAAYLESLSEAGVTHVELSIHHVEAGPARQISRHKHTFEKQLQAVENILPLLESERLFANVNTVIIRQNMAILPELLLTFRQRFPRLKDFFFNFVDPIGYSGGNEALVPRYREARPHLLEALDRALEYGQKVTTDNIPLCCLGRHLLTARPTVEKLKGVQYAKKTQRIQNITPEDDRGQYYHVNGCLRCSLQPLCAGVNFRYLALYGPGEFRPERRKLKEVIDGAAPTAQGELIEVLKRVKSPPRQPLHRVLVPALCNNRCPNCPFELKGARGDDPEVEKQLRTGVLSGYGGATFTGGEPTVDRRLVQWVRTAKSMGYQELRLETNGRALSYREWTRKLIKAGVNWLQISLHGPDEQTHDREVQVKGAFSQTLKGLENALSLRGCYVSLRTVVTRRNIALFPEITAQFSELGIHEYLVELPDKSLEGQMEELAEKLGKEGLEVHLTFRKAPEAGP